MKNYHRPNRYVRANRCTVRRPVTAANSYGWVVNDWEAREAYDFACDYFGEDELNSQIVGCMSSEELAACLAFLFRMNDFREWTERDNEEDDDEDIESATKICNSRKIASNRRTVSPRKRRA